MTDTRISVHRKCPLCSCKTGELLHSIDFAIDDHNVLPNHYDIICCDSCSFIYDDFSEPDSVFSRHYAESQKYSDPQLFGGGGLSPEEIQMWEKYYQLISAYIRPDMKILEVGCGKGGFLETLRKHGFQQLSGLDQSVECLQILRSRQFESLDSWTQIGNRKFDLVISHAVFEHLPDPREMMARIRNVLSDDGFLFITVPDADSYCKYDAAPFYYFDREHINHFTSSTLQLLCSLYSFSPVSTQIIQNKSIGPMKFHYDIAGIFQLREKQLTRSVRKYIDLCGSRKIHIPPEIFASEHVFLWGIGAFAENLLIAGYFNPAKDLHLLDVDMSKQEKMIVGKIIEPPESLLDSDPEKTAVVITSVLYKDKIIESLQTMGFRGKYYMVYQD